MVPLGVVRGHALSLQRCALSPASYEDVKDRSTRLFVAVFLSWMNAAVVLVLQNMF